MNNGYKHHHHNNQNQNITYLPLLCRASTQDIKVVVPRASGDPSSPRVTCIGHVKRSSKVIGYPAPKFSPSTSATAATPSSRRSIHHQQRFHNSKSAPRTPLKTITKATIATSPGVCGLPRGSVLISNHSPLRPKTKHQKSSNQPYPSPRATSPSVGGLPRGSILISNQSPLRHKTKHQKPSNPPNPTPRATITAITTTATSPDVCELRRGSILISNQSPLRPKTKHQKSSNPPNPTPRATTPHSHAPARGIILNANYSTLNPRPVSKSTCEKSSAGSWMNLNSTVKSNINYMKLKILLFPEKTKESITRNSCRTREVKVKPEINDTSCRSYDVESDPPLPVVKKVKEPGFDREEVNIWKRRSGKTGIELKSLKIQKIHVSNNNIHQIPTTV